jgi:hypothetical protein
MKKLKMTETQIEKVREIVLFPKNVIEKEAILFEDEPETLRVFQGTYHQDFTVQGENLIAPDGKVAENFF